MVLLDRNELTSGSTFHSAGPGRAAALERVADPDDDGLGGALPRARLRLGGVRRHPAGLHAGARAGGDAPGGLGQDLRAAARAALGRGGARAVPADGHRRRALRVLPAHRRLPRSVAADLRAGRGRARRRLPGVHPHPRERDRRCRRPRAGRADRSGATSRPRSSSTPAGMFAAEIGRMAGVRVPIVPFAHEYLVTQPFRDRAPGRAPAHAARPRPADLLPRGGRRPGDGRLRARTARPWALDEHLVDRIPPDFNGRLLEEDWPRFEEIAQNSSRRVPAMARRSRSRA